jgi:hypothetical protein
MKQISTKHLKFAHNAWMRGLGFYELELSFLRERLEEIAGGNTGREVGENVEHFQNQLIIHRDYLDGLKHRIRGNQGVLENEISVSPEFIDNRELAVYTQLSDDYMTEEKMVNELRHEFNHFAAKWL